MAQKVLFQDSLTNKSIIIVLATFFVLGIFALSLIAVNFDLPKFTYPFLSIMVIVPLVLLCMMYKISITANEHNLTIVMGIGLIKSIIPYTAIEKDTIEQIDILPLSTGVTKKDNYITYSMKDVSIATKFTTKSNNHYTITTNKAAELTQLLLEKVS